MQKIGLLLLPFGCAFALGCSSGGGGGGFEGGTPEGDGSADAWLFDAGKAFDDFQVRNLVDINGYRAQKGLAPLVLDKDLCTFALAASKQLSMDHTAHGYFDQAKTNGSIWKDGFKMLADENQGDPDGWMQLAMRVDKNELLQIDAIVATMFAEGPEASGNYANIMNPKLKRLGVGLVEDQGKLFLSNEFSD